MGWVTASERKKRRIGEEGKHVLVLGIGGDW